MEQLIILWLWLKALGFFLTVAFVALVIIGALLWCVGGWIWDTYRRLRHGKDTI
jgi:hypothetical protein